MKVKVADQAGYCYGVERALKLTEKAVSSGQRPIYTLGPIIHNPQVVESFAARGVKTIEAIDEVTTGTVVVRTHGVDPSVIEEAKNRRLHVLDATCPFVAKAQQKAAELVEDGYQLIIVGEPDHPEVAGILAHTRGQAIVADSLEDLMGKKLKGKVGIVVQTTQPVEKLQEMAGFVAARGSELRVCNTICNATARRQRSARELAKEANLMIVVGGKNSANTTRLAQICGMTGTKSYHIETAAELDRAWLHGKKLIGLTSGASTPDWLLEEVAKEIRRLAK